MPDALFLAFAYVLVGGFCMEICAHIVRAYDGSDFRHPLAFALAFLLLWPLFAVGAFAAYLVWLACVLVTEARVWPLARRHYRTLRRAGMPARDARRLARLAAVHTIAPAPPAATA